MSNSTSKKRAAAVKKPADKPEAKAETITDLTIAIRLTQGIEVICPTEEECRQFIHQQVKKHKNKSPEYIPRVPNAWMYYSTLFNARLREPGSKLPVISQPVIQTVIGRRWSSLPSSAKTGEWHQVWLWFCDEHKKMYPQYVYKPQRPSKYTKDGSEKQTKKQTKKQPARKKKAKVAVAVEAANEPYTSSPTGVSTAPMAQFGVADTVAAAATSSFAFPVQQLQPFPMYNIPPMLPVPLIPNLSPFVPALEFQFSPRDYAQLQDASIAGPSRRTTHHHSLHFHPYDGFRNAIQIPFYEVNSLPTTAPLDEGPAEVQAFELPEVDNLEYNWDTESYEIRFNAPSDESL